MSTYTIQPSDVGKSVLKINGEYVFLASSIGYIQSQDVGKKIFIRHSKRQTLLTMESTEQYRTRIGNQQHYRAIHAQKDPRCPMSTTAPLAAQEAQAKLQAQAQALVAYLATKYDANSHPEGVIITAEVNSPLYERLLDLAIKIQHETHVSMVSSYSFLLESLQRFINSDDLKSAYENVEADLMTTDLASWLSESPSHVFYLTRALEDSQPTDGFQALSLAQLEAKRDVFHIVRRELEAHV